jgi:hypothetical protein
LRAGPTVRSNHPSRSSAAARVNQPVGDGCLPAAVPWAWSDRVARSL